MVASAARTADNDHEVSVAAVASSSFSTSRCAADEGARCRVWGLKAMAFFFISHASEDRASAEGLYGQLKDWGFSSVFLDAHPHDGLAVGVEWERELYRQVRTADAVIFLGSPTSV